MFFTNEGSRQPLSIGNAYSRSVFRVDKAAMVVGMHPTNLGIASMSSWVRLFMLAMVAGIEPSTCGMPPKLKDTRPVGSVGW